MFFAPSPQPDTSVPEKLWLLKDEENAKLRQENVQLRLQLAALQSGSSFGWPEQDAFNAPCLQVEQLALLSVPTMSMFAPFAAPSATVLRCLFWH